MRLLVPASNMQRLSWEPTQCWLWRLGAEPLLLTTPYQLNPSLVSAEGRFLTTGSSAGKNTSVQIQAVDSDMMCESPQDVYAKYLPSNHGYPLWFPEPSSTLPSSYKADGLQIGDVGYVDGDGAFNVLFNISFRPNHALNQRLGVSSTFDPVGLDANYDVNVKLNAIPLGCSITSPGITQPTQTSQRVGHYEFTPSSTKGAILILPDGAASYNLSAPANERFRKLAMEHAFDWYQIVQEHCGESVRNGSLYLLTGFYKAPSWSLASFHDGTGTEDRHIWVVPREGERKAAGRVWRHTFPLQYRDGPESAQYGSVNQTVFIRGFKIAVRDDVLGWLSQKPDLLPVPAVPPRKAPCGFARFLVRLLGKKNTSKRRHKVDGTADVNHVPRLSQPFHPSDNINRYLLDKDPNALVAVTHDSEWMTLIETGELSPGDLTQRDRLEKALSKYYSLHSQPEDSAVCLQGNRMSVALIDICGRASN
ncbi:hypothetical protein L210DRAFT_2747694 [Boletus edulis BED1]|uniref:Uncharacterized protein n=1 Tax=Boletus edulis BED1 TaxID=1328754 RepID=A0AAD4BB16_BOLED|nr:hypothetical protein L210DRAFT_2747694 [Boletus edulis BED1]